MGEQLFAIVYKKRIITGYTKATSKKPSAPKIKWEQGYRAPSREDDNSAYIDSILADKMPEWEALDVLPNESIPFGFETNIRWPLHLYGIKKWSQFFTARQLLCHGTAIEIFREIFNEEVANDGQLSDMHRSSLGYLAVAISRLIDWNSRQCTWELGKLRMAHTFAVHAFPIKWSFAEMSPLVEGLGYDWSLKQTAKCLDELIDLIDGKNNVAQRPTISLQKYRTQHIYCSACHLVMPARRRARPHSKRERRCRRNGPAILRKSNVRGAQRFLLCMA
jgi:adenine-specific DNA methylase